MSRSGGQTPAQTVMACAQLLTHFENPQRSPNNLHVLIGFGGALLEAIVTDPVAAGTAADHWPDHAQLTDETAIARQLELAAVPELCVQIAAATELDRIHALRCIEDRLPPDGYARLEILGGFVRSGEDAFGFKAGSDYEPVLPDYETPQGGTWLSCSHFDLKVRDFFQQHPGDGQRAMIMAQPPAVVVPPSIGAGAFTQATKLALDHVNAPARRDGIDAAVKNGAGHKRHMLPHRATILRRGFTCRVNGREGLAFIAAASSLAAIQNAFARFNNGDGLAAFAELGLRASFYCPPDDTFVAAPAAWPMPPHCREAQNPVELITYEVDPEEIQYITIAADQARLMDPDKVYGAQVVDPDFEAIFLDLDDLIANRSGQPVADITAKRMKMLLTSNTTNAWMNYYMKKG